MAGRPYFLNVSCRLRFTLLRLGFDKLLKKKLEVIYSDADIVVVNKPSGMSVTKDRAGSDDVMLAIEKETSLEGEFRLIYRLDKLESGILVIARNAETQSSLASALEKRKIDRKYLAIVSGFVPHESGTIKTPISHSKKESSKMHVDPRRGGEAITEWQLLAEFGQLSLVFATPITVRTHQLRIHLESAGMPLAIDPLYSNNEPIMLSQFKRGYRLAAGRTENPLINRLTLHAYSLKLPGYDKPFVARPDKKFVATLKMLSRHTRDMARGFLSSECLEKIDNGQYL